ncbi:MAG: MFS transporter [Candidatus Latescibacteria bacterium]|nr:MFS transporter [Candidatus Latescibacterota bacterium]NIO56757.1 MFS transporter [Candidatus Latescibacterota bacterium]NIT02342.1 MFS transporter [Candidatus Latescibacterota bacterium]NIT39225.1 MFS transporter [Candidatus Latescibacterota bacterium]
MSENDHSESTSSEEKESKGIPNPFAELASSFRALKGAPIGFWYTNFAYWLDGISYFGMLTLLAMFFHDVAGLSDSTGHKLVSIYTGLITGFMLIFGPVSDKLGVRRSLIISALLYIIGRSVLPLVPSFLLPGSISMILICLVALVVAAAGNGFMQPSCYAGVRKFSDEKTAAMGYGLLYAGMNLGIVIIGIISPRIRTGIHIGSLDFDGFGIVGVFWFCVFVNVLMLLGLIFLFTNKIERESEQASAGSTEKVEEPAREDRQSSKNPLRAIADWFKGAPISDGRFMFFIFVLMPVQTLFAYQWLVLPQYVTRAYSQIVADNMESIVNIANPLIIVLGVPVITALTRKVPVYRMMIIGSLVSALPTFFFCLGPKFHLLMSYIILFSLGEAMWQPRFLQFAAELAPKGKTGAYIAYANIPWFMIKALAGLYTGKLMESYCPAGGPFNTETMWLIYGFIAVTSPVGLVLGSRWVEKGLKVRSERAVEA